MSKSIEFTYPSQYATATITYAEMTDWLKKNGYEINPDWSIEDIVNDITSYPEREFRDALADIRGIKVDADTLSWDTVEEGATDASCPTSAYNPSVPLTAGEASLTFSI